MAKLILARIDDRDSSLDVSLSLYRKALAARPVGHFDPSSNGPVRKRFRVIRPAKQTKQTRVHCDGQVIQDRK
ncbi:hypothetical protein JVT61DRAFT_9004 [Boletus reticuloceps]|uniref:Uncharacterized protein n=1 Tax=Boletus reticuloceps TaxID=495285 RepID=A0A8I3A5L5_9AGAM|nr:hypothetical protein JVT61DRAFT_9004 [Boletus reticuloceps]